jgi:hypothetical protein
MAIWFKGKRPDEDDEFDITDCVELRPLSALEEARVLKRLRASVDKAGSDAERSEIEAAFEIDIARMTAAGRKAAAKIIKGRMR